MHAISFAVLRSFLWGLSFLSWTQIYKLAEGLTPFCYFAIPKYRKRALSNLACAKDLHLSNLQIKYYSKKSLFNLLLTALEYGKLKKIKSLDGLVTCKNKETASLFLDQKKGVVFFCGHQSNWELLFLDATSRHKGVCIGKPVKNTYLYNFILSIRKKFKGEVVIPKDAYKACIRALKRGELVGVVGDQGMPDSPFSFYSFGRKAHATTLPALLAMRSSSPLIVATIVRHVGKYEITYSDPITCDENDPDPIGSLTQKSLVYLDGKIKEHIDQWMWQHNRWKINYPPFIPKRFRHDAILIIVPKHNEPFLSELYFIQETFKDAYLIMMIPKGSKCPIVYDELYEYKTAEDCFIQHFGPKMVFDGLKVKGLKKHFMNLSCFTYLQLDSPKNLITQWKKSHAD